MWGVGCVWFEFVGWFVVVVVLCYVFVKLVMVGLGVVYILGFVVVVLGLLWRICRFVDVILEVL